MSVFDGSRLKEHWKAEIRNMVDEPILEQKPCDKCADYDKNVCPNYWVVKSWFEFIRLVGALQYNNPKYLLWFRGENKRHTNATPKAFRSVEYWNDFLKTSKWFDSNSGKGRLFNNRSKLARWAILQHYGAPTPLLDVTTSLRIAIFNALVQPKANNTNNKDEKNKKDVSPNISVFITPRPLDGINIFAEIGLCIVDLTAELPSHCLRPHVQRAGFLGLTDKVMKGLVTNTEKPSKKLLAEEASLDCVRIARICIPKAMSDHFKKLECEDVFPPASKYTIIGNKYKKEDIIRNESKTDDMSGDYLLRALYELKEISESNDPCPLEKEFPNHYWENP